GVRRWPVRTPLAEGVVLHGGEVALARDADPARDPALLLRLAAAAAPAGAPIPPGTLGPPARPAPPPPPPRPPPPPPPPPPDLAPRGPPAARDWVCALRAAGPGRVAGVEALDRTGLWGRLFPEWGAIRDLPPRDSVHLWTVDRHLVQTTVQAAALATTVDRP